MKKSVICPMCSNDLPQSRMFAGMICCPCGWTYSHGEYKDEMKSGVKANISILMFALALIGLVIHVVIWDTHSITIIQPTVKHLTRTANLNDYALMAHICKERGRYNCQVDALGQLIKSDETELEAFGALAKAHWDHKQTEPALANLQLYFDKGGQDLDLAYLYATVLRSARQFSQAEAYYKLVLRSKPEVIQTTIVKEYVTMLTDTNQFNKASKEIQFYRRKSTRPATFMSKEIKAISDKTRLAKI